MSLETLLRGTPCDSFGNLHQSEDCWCLCQANAAVANLPDFALRNFEKSGDCALQVTELEQSNSDLEDSNTKLEASLGLLKAELQAAKDQASQGAEASASQQQALEQAQQQVTSLEAHMTSLKVGTISEQNCI